MIDFTIWKLTESQQNVQGPGIKAMQDAFVEMGERGVPTEYNDYGFNKQDWNSYINFSGRGYLASESIPVSVAVQMLKILSHYKNTQIKNFAQINDLVKKDFSQISQDSVSEKSGVFVYDRQPLKYGKVSIYIPNGIDRSMVIAINKIIDKSFETEGAEKTIDNFGNMNFPRFKKFSADKEKLHHYLIEKSILPEILNFLKTKGLSVESESGSVDFSKPQAEKETQDNLQILGIEETPYGKKLGIVFNSSFSKSSSTFQSLKSSGLTPKGVSYAKDPPRFLVNIEDLELFSKVTEIISKSGFDTSELQKYSPQATKQAKKPKSGSEFLFFQDLEEDKVKIKPDYRSLTPEKKQFIKESIQYSFPQYQWNKEDYSYTVSGSYKQYVNFGIVLKKFGYNVEKLREILKSKLQNKKLEKTTWEGQHDNDENFLSSIDSKFPESNFDLFGEQKKGVAFLYGRNFAILGDETGFGKSVQMIYAAELRMQKESRPTLIITLKAVQNQFAKEIINALGEKEKDNISLDPVNPKKWTIVRYDNFSSGKNIENNIAALKKANFGIVIFDELHKVKHSTSKRSQNISQVIENIPTRWGATATISSNKPMDIRNQLVMTGHHLGKISEGKFKRDFAGMAATGYGGSYEAGDFENQIRSAEKLNKWLVLSGLYIRRSKDDVREMPELKTSDSIVSLDSKKFNHFYNNKISTYQSPNLAISKLSAARETNAHLKTDQTTDKVIDIVSKNLKKPENNYAASKVVVFTNFVEAGRQLVEKIKEKLKRIDPNFYVLEYLGSTKQKARNEVKSKFTNDPNAKVLVMSMKMGGTGIDFPNASQNMVINDFDWTPESAEQSEGRIYRINTNHPVNIEYVVSNGLDKDLYDLLQKKRKLAEVIQTYRKDYYEKEHDDESLDKIVSLRKEMASIDNAIVDRANKELPGSGDALNSESFRDYLSNEEQLKEYLIY